MSNVTCQVCGTQYDPREETGDLPPLDMAFTREESSEEVSHAAGLRTPLNELPTNEGDSGDFEEVKLPAIDNAMDEMESENLPPVDELDPFSQGDKAKDFQQSESVFEELRNFGESLQEDEEDIEKTNPTQGSAKLPQSPAAPKASGGGLAMTSAPVLQGFKIGHYFTPVSLSAAVKRDAEEPLKEAFGKFNQKVSETGANAVVDLKWNLSGDGSKVLICGTPVKCVKES